MKALKTLIYTENSKYQAGNRQIALAWIDSKNGTAESRESENEDYKKYGTFRNCLEEVGRFFEEDCKSIVYCVTKEQLVLVRKFIELVETKLKINIKEKSLIFETNSANIAAIRVSPFWMDCPLKRRVFLIFLRAGLYYKDTYKDDVINQTITAYYESKYGDYLSSSAGEAGKEKITNTIKNVTKGLEIFLDGYTEFSEDCLTVLANNFHTGFVNQFKEKLPEQIKDIMLFKL